MDKSEITNRPPCPPFTEETAWQKVKSAEAAWNTWSVLNPADQF